jgi:hypothetical protein
MGNARLPKGDSEQIFHLIANALHNCIEWVSVMPRDASMIEGPEIASRIV